MKIFFMTFQSPIVFLQSGHDGIVELVMSSTGLFQSPIVFLQSGHKKNVKMFLKYSRISFNPLSYFYSRVIHAPDAEALKGMYVYIVSIPYRISTVGS